MCSVLVGVWVWNVLKDLKATAWVFCFPDPDSNGKDKWKWIARWLDSNLRTKALKTLSFKNIQTQLLITSKRCFFQHAKAPPPTTFTFTTTCLPASVPWRQLVLQPFPALPQLRSRQPTLPPRLRPPPPILRCLWHRCFVGWHELEFTLHVEHIPKKLTCTPPKQNTNKIKRLLFFNRCFLFFYPFPGVIFKGLPVF